MRILIVDDEPVALSSVRRILRRQNFRNIDTCDNGAAAIARIREGGVDVVLLDVILPDSDGLQVLESAKPYAPQTEFIMLTAVDDVKNSVRAVRMGAYDYLVKPVDPARLVLTIERACERRSLRAGMASDYRNGRRVPEVFSDTVTRDPRMIELLRYAGIMAKSGTPFLITGESGTGKGLLARGIHRSATGNDRPFVQVNVSSVPETLFEGQFFGYVKGAYTGAEISHTGYFEQAGGGTLFLDEIGEIPSHLQVKLLKTLEEKTLVRIGETRPRRVDFRVISSTNRDLDQACREGRFRLDLLYRLNAAHVHLPPLRERAGDIPLLADHFLKKACQRHGSSVAFSSAAMDLLRQRAYPGNIRELAQVAERCVLLADGDRILPCHLDQTPASAISFGRTLCTLKENDEVHVAYVLEQSGGDRKKAAEILGVSVRQVQRKLAQMREQPRWQFLFQETRLP
ncbi:sigma-54-dependent Fis family transcriptional re gulator [Desulfonema ishimotonii]|uniref:Sigma-54-dependent Fis family transcriptional re gulator n=1 Tax=Desulfonema ishimotonii TaxID=45657 RepID=A0A401G327_9BACT|nr:sigma-54 dependent transcriptional regulator [Desulfonema ishimotonii]GBC63648.1 sigma-54-dependent Fis family transcriptional re gulator [Desulfonema ishimotonii]